MKPKSWPVIILPALDAPIEMDKARRTYKSFCFQSNLIPIVIDPDVISEVGRPFERLTEAVAKALDIITDASTFLTQNFSVRQFSSLFPNDAPGEYILTVGYAIRVVEKPEAVDHLSLVKVAVANAMLEFSREGLVSVWPIFRGPEQALPGNERTTKLVDNLRDREFGLGCEIFTPGFIVRNDLNTIECLAIIKMRSTSSPKLKAYFA